MVPYVPPAHGSQFSGRAISQQYQPCTYGLILDDGCTINSVILPSKPTGSIPPPPPSRRHDHSSINVDRGEIRSYFGGSYRQS